MLWKLVAAASRASLPLAIVRGAPWIIVLTVIVANLWLLHVGPDTAPAWLLRRWEWGLYDWRVRLGAAHPDTRGPAAAAPGVVLLTEHCLDVLRQEKVQWPLPRDLYAEVIRELHERGATWIGIDGLFYDVHWLSLAYRENVRGPMIQDGDAILAATLEELGHVILAAGASDHASNAVLFPRPEFSTHAAAVGHVALLPDRDGVRRRVPPRMAGWDNGVLRDAWHIGLVLGARQAGLDLDKAEIRACRLRLPFQGAPHRFRDIPLDRSGNLLIDWELRHSDSPPLRTNLFSTLLLERRARAPGVRPTQDWAGRMVVICSTASGSNIEDRGPSPLEPNDVGGSVIWNVAHSVVRGQCVQQSPPWLDTIIIAGLGLVAGVWSWRLRALWASLAVGGIACAYLGVAVWAYTAQRWWIPVVQPLAGALAVTYLFMVSYRLFGEMLLTRRDLAPYVVEALWPHRLHNPRTKLRTATVFFADIRGFSDWLRDQCEEVGAWYRRTPVPGATEEDVTSAAEEQFLSVTRDYLARVADCIQDRQGTLDKFIGDCVMAFWGAPVRYERHAELAVQAAMDAQRAVAELNAARASGPRTLSIQVPGHKLSVEVPLSEPLQLEFGVSLHCGIVSVGAVGDARHLSNYTVSGRVVNEASRLQAAAGRGRIVCTGEVLAELQRLESPLASLCLEPRPLTLAGRTVSMMEIDWMAARKSEPRKGAKAP